MTHSQLGFGSAIDKLHKSSIGLAFVKSVYLEIFFLFFNQTYVVGTEKKIPQKSKSCVPPKLFLFPYFALVPLVPPGFMQIPRRT